jgi:hypothetical protein
MSIVEKLTEGIINRDLSKEGAALISKWEKTGLLEGLEHDHLRNGMASLLENQAKELLRESSSMSGGDVEGFAAVAFPLVRRVFGNLIANDLVSVQPMSLPSGLIFFLDFTVSAEMGASANNPGRLGYPSESSLFGGGVVGRQLTGGVDLGSADAMQLAEQGPYALNNAYSSPTGSVLCNDTDVSSNFAAVMNFTFGDTSDLAYMKSVEWDPDFTSGSTQVAVVSITKTGDALAQLNLKDLVTIQISSSTQSVATGLNLGANGSSAARLVRRHTRFSGSSDSVINLVFIGTGSNGSCTTSAALAATLVDVFTGSANQLSWAEEDDFINSPNSSAQGAIVGDPQWGLENNPNIPEIDIKIDSVAVTAMTKKLKAKWTPELGQDLNAYHNLDAEVELTQILSEQIALEIDREILEDLVQGATAATRYWSRAPGRFLDRVTGAEVGASTVTPDFTGNVSEWYETLVETINDVSANIHRKTLRGGANFIVVGPEVANILEFTAGFRANVSVDSDRGTVGTVKVGALSKKWDIYVDPYFLRQVVLVGRKGGSFLESGYVYAPYVPLQTTPTIFGVEDFVPRKGVMTRYAKKMVRPDMYGLVIISDMTVG